MPLIVITGVPSSGKSTRALELRDYFLSLGKEVHVVSENFQISKANFDKNVFYSDSNKEKHVRGVLKSEILRLITPTNVVVLDGLNYIKGYRYELFCAAKNNKNRQCTLHCEINREEAWQFNENRNEETAKYTRVVFNGLIQRYEDPDGKNRWDSPLFTIFPHQDLDKKAIESALFQGGVPLPNMSTQNTPLSSTNFLYDLDQTTKKIVESLVKCKNMGVMTTAKIDGFPDLSVDISNATPQKLMILRRQYLTYCKMHPPDAKNIPQLFVQYLKTSLQ